MTDVHSIVNVCEKLKCPLYRDGGCTGFSNVSLCPVGWFNPDIKANNNSLSADTVDININRLRDMVDAVVSSKQSQHQLERS